jgi:hypothetical protein
MKPGVESRADKAHKPLATEESLLAKAVLKNVQNQAAAMVSSF